MSNFYNLKSEIKTEDLKEPASDFAAVCAPGTLKLSFTDPVLDGDCVYFKAKLDGAGAAAPAAAAAAAAAAAREPKKEIGDELLSFYSDIAELEKTSAPHTAASSPEPPPPPPPPEIVREAVLIDREKDNEKEKEKDPKVAKKKSKVQRQKRVMRAEGGTATEGMCPIIPTGGPFMNGGHSGIPETNNENLLQIFTKITEIAGFPINVSTDIDFITRVAHMESKSKKPKAIIVRFLARYKKDDCLSRLRKLRDFKACDAGFAGSNSSIYFNDHLTKANKLLLKDAKKLAAEKSYKWVWVRHCCIMVRRDDTSKVLNILTSEDLKEIK
ncbi:hypothetical protein MSG28_009994 [Choristoneura fumiferana]|uniref:Uncharacterized protein n=1 Tax=Choristoneura fumiferana TaxID=7141 RepID=A0ACC0JD90_CHOFU|nr:hypothetical protein MSG28_009994 [Choristoneura fumiferana]